MWDRVVVVVADQSIVQKGVRGGGEGGGIADWTGWTGLGYGDNGIKSRGTHGSLLEDGWKGGWKEWEG